MTRALFLLLLVFAATPWCGPATALSAGIALRLLLGNPWPEKTTAWSKRLLEGSVIGLGFGVAFAEVWQAGREAVLYTPVSIGLTVAAGLLLGRLLRVPRHASALISFGTSICGGSAIAAMAPVLDASDDDTSLSLATVFSLNALALVLFPPLGHLFGLTERQFGLWAALAIHDTSSVVGACSAFGATALAMGTTVKLARAVWIAPCALLASRLTLTQARPRMPWFILGFLAAAALRGVLPAALPLWEILAGVARQGLVVTLFLVGLGLSREVLQRVGLRPLLQGALLWILVSAAVLAALLGGVLR